jgi:hypothetical protein
MVSFIYIYCVKHACDQAVRDPSFIYLYLTMIIGIDCVGPRALDQVC